MATPRVRQIELALQGGGAHGAFTWGVLDRLLEDERIRIAAISGASAGAMNAVVLADGLMAGGRRGARDALRRFWNRVSHATGQGAMPSEALGTLFGPWSIEGSPMQHYMEWIGRSFSPYQFNPFDLNPLRDILASEVDFERVRTCEELRLFVSATNVRTGALKIFRPSELSVEAVMASACLPMMFRAVEIDGEAYWDGGYVGNPPLLPLIAESPCHDLVLVQINPSRREGVPTTAAAILDRLNEITFNSSLVKELRSVALIRKLLRSEGRLDASIRAPLFTQIASLHLHRIAAESALAELGLRSQGRTGWPFLNRLHQIGRNAADTWIDKNFAHLGRRSTLDLDAYLD